jgi:hypothetical protein
MSFQLQEPGKPYLKNFNIFTEDFEMVSYPQTLQFLFQKELALKSLVLLRHLQPS